MISEYLAQLDFVAVALLLSRTIQGKEVAMEGYRATACGWRPASTFARNSFYNLCLPVRPTIY